MKTPRSHVPGEGLTIEGYRPSGEGRPAGMGCARGSA